MYDWSFSFFLTEVSFFFHSSVYDQLGIFLQVQQICKNSELEYEDSFVYSRQNKYITDSGDNTEKIWVYQFLSKTKTIPA